MVNKIGILTTLAVAIMIVAASGIVAATANDSGSATTSTAVNCRFHIYGALIGCNTTTEINSTSTITETLNSTVTSVSVVTISQLPPFWNVSIGTNTPVIPCQTYAQYQAYANIYNGVSAQGTWTGCHGVVGDAVLPKK